MGICGGRGPEGRGGIGEPGGRGPWPGRGVPVAGAAAPAARVAGGTGVLAFGATLKECEDELRSTLEDWILVGLKLGHPLPVVDGIDLNKEPELMIAEVQYEYES